MTVATRDAVQPRGAIRLMFDRDFGGIFWGKLLASAGVWIHSIVAAIVVFDATQSAFVVGLVTVAQFGPQLLLTPLSGTYADRGHLGRQILLGRILCVAGSGLLAAWLWLQPSASEVNVTAGVLLGSLLVGLGFVVGGPAMQSVVPALIRPGELGTAMALNTAPMTTARMAGPALGALVAAQLGPAAGFAIAAATHLVFVVIIFVVRFPPAPVRPPTTDYSVRAALRHVRQDRPLLLLLVGVSAAGFGSEPSLMLAPAVADELGGDAFLVGELSAAFGVGAAVALVALSLVKHRISPAVSSSIGLWFLALGPIGVACSPQAWPALGSFALAGFGFSWSMTGLSTLIQERAPEYLRGRIMALWMVGFIGSRPIAAAILGTASDLVSVRAAFLLAAGLLAVAAFACRPKLLS